ncbi:MAG TPA: carbon-nitrogen hydrolase family protein [Tepidisphaeraceae bacterium]|nr:carbon-nitrogen hydrolase family protein [Tepidisphaeraceae bacterium]
MQLLGTFQGDSAEGWIAWSPRREIQPICDIDPYGSQDGQPALRIRCEGNGAAIGGWKRRVEGIVPGRMYRLIAHYLPTGISHERQCVSVRLDWRDAKGGRPRQPDAAIATARAGGWSVIDYTTRAPDGATSVTLELELRWSAGGSVRWDRISLTEAESPSRRMRLGTVCHRPQKTGSAGQSVARFCHLVERANHQADLICLPEGITVVGTDQSYLEVSEPIPGPTTQTLGELARRLNTCLVAGIYERLGPILYNTAVLIDRGGGIVGTYRKAHLPQEEVEAGITPGDCFPVFRTEWAAVGMMICWDVQFPEAARQLALGGAEVIALPIWGGNETLARARAIENHVHLVSSSYDMKSFIVDPTGQVLAEATVDRPVAVTQIDLATNLYQPWLGDMRHRTWKERRGDLVDRRQRGNPG